MRFTITRPSGRGQELFLVAFIIYASSASAIVSGQDGTHFALTWSMATSHSFSLDSGAGLYASQQYTAKVGNSVFSALPPGLSFFGLGMVALIDALLPNTYSALVSEYAAVILSSVIGASAVFFFYKLARLIGSERISALLALVFAFGTGMWAYSRVYLPEALATLLGIISVYCVVLACMRASEKDKPAHNLSYSFYSGISLGLMITVDNMGFFFALPLVLFLVAGKKTRVFAFLFEGLVLGMLPFAFYNLSTAGSILAAPYGLTVLGGVPLSDYGSKNFLPGLYQVLLGTENGLIFFSPIIVLCIIALFKFARQELATIGLFISLFLSIFLPFALQSPATYLHNGVGPSEIVLGLPYLLLLGSRIESLSRRGIGTVLAMLLGIFSFVVNGIVALTTPVTNPALGHSSSGLSSSLLQTNIQLFRVGAFSAWWSSFHQSEFFACLILAFPVFVLIIYSLDLFIHRRTVQETRTINTTRQELFEEKLF